MPRPTRRWGTPLVLAFGLSLLLAAPSVATDDPNDIGFHSSYKPTDGGGTPMEPTGSKPESKLWYHDGNWFAVMFYEQSGVTGGEDFYIYRFDRQNNKWIRNANAKVDTRYSSRADALKVGTQGQVYIATHVFSESPASGDLSCLVRFNYNSTNDTYTRDSATPAGGSSTCKKINNFKTETLVIDEDSTGQLWATWVQGGKVWVNRSASTGPLTWGTPFALTDLANVGGGGVTTDDISSVVSFGTATDPKIGVMWSNQTDKKMYFAVHDDAAGDQTWGSAVLAYGPSDGESKDADDHISLKSLQSDSTGRVYAVIKTGKSASTDPQIVVLRRNFTNGNWAAGTFGTVANNHTRPILVLDNANQLVRVFAAGPNSPGAPLGDYGGTIYEKTTPFDGNLEFEPGLGTARLRDARPDGNGQIDNVTTTKQEITSSSGLVILASSHATKRYWFRFDPLGGSEPTNTAPVASDDTYATTKDQQLTVPAPGVLANDSDPNGDPLTASGPANTAQGGKVTINRDGSFSYTPAADFVCTDTFDYTASDGTLTDSPRVSITVTEPSTVPTLTDDAFVTSVNPTSTAGGTSTVLKNWFKDANNQNHSYLMFDVPTSGTGTLRVWVSDASDALITVEEVQNTAWDESTITWNTRPTETATPIATAQGTPGIAGEWLDFNIGPVTAGVHTYRLAGGNADAAQYSSKEAAGTSQDPHLVITTP